MSSTSPDRHRFTLRGAIAGLAAATAMTGAIAQAPSVLQGVPVTAPASTTTPALTNRQLALGPIAAYAAVGEMEKLTVALNEGLDAGLAVGEIKEALVQLYAYAGFPRSLNALTALMK